MKTFGLVALLILLLAAALMAEQEAVIEYLEGDVEIGEESEDDTEWVYAYIGDLVPLTASLRVAEQSSVELSLGDVKATLSKSGTYVVGAVFDVSAKMSSWGLGSLVASKMRRAVKGQKGPDQTAVGGVRGASQEKQPEWLDGEDIELLEVGEELLDEGDYEGALAVFEEAFDLADEANEELILFKIGYAYAMLGQRLMALEVLSEIEPGPDQLFFDDLVVLNGMLLVESFAAEEALALLTQYLDLRPDGTAAQTVYLLSGLCHRSLNNEETALQMLGRAVDIDPTSEAGKFASALMHAE